VGVLVADVTRRERGGGTGRVVEENGRVSVADAQGWDGSSDVRILTDGERSRRRSGSVAVYGGQWGASGLQGDIRYLSGWR